MTVVIVLTILVIVLSAIVLAISAMTLKLLRKQKSETTVSAEKSDGDVVANRIERKIEVENAGILATVRAQVDATKDITARFDNFMLSVDSKLDKMRDDNSKNLSVIRDENSKNLTIMRDDNVKNLKEVKEDNEKQLEKMRQTVDNKLSETLDDRFNKSFKLISDRMVEINKSFSEMQNLQTGVNDLRNLLGGVKTRGTWGEVSLDSLLSQILVDEQFARQYKLSKGNDVDFVIKLPGKGNGEVLLPIDSKFPIEDYQRLVEASANADKAGVAIQTKALEKRIKLEAQSISSKYIQPPKTTDFAILYLPTESLFAEIIKISGLVEELQTRFRIVVAGPTTLAALLNSLQMGFKSVAVEKRSVEIADLMRKFVKDFATFSDLLSRTSKQIGTVQTTIESATKRTQIIQKSLDKVQKYADTDSISATSDFEELVTFDHLALDGGGDDDNEI